MKRKLGVTCVYGSLKKEMEMMLSQAALALSKSRTKKRRNMR
jgi:hypothetical protein